EPPDTGWRTHQTNNECIPRASHNFYICSEVCLHVNWHMYPVDGTILNYRLVQPVGVSARVSPLNVPCKTAIWKVAPCLALGNT
ncbi:aldehyde dehydrogenase family protein, partial [Escherichia coli]|uniref:aldehyde dehydrogenase family protein n=1 Tax=Escherichia coli TaxID=562 RepID=UPI0012BA2523